MKSWNVSTRLYVVVGVAALVMAAPAVAVWSSVSRLGELQDESFKRSEDALHLRETAEFATKLYRIVADSYINREFDQTQKDWLAVSAKADAAISLAGSLADSEEQSRGVTQVGLHTFWAILATERNATLEDAPAWMAAICLAIC